MVGEYRIPLLVRWPVRVSNPPMCPAGSTVTKGEALAPCYWSSAPSLTPLPPIDQM